MSNALAELNFFSNSGGGEAKFVERAGDDGAPLLFAVYGGYAEIVEALLKKKIVQASVNNIEENGLSAWMYANFSLKQNYWVCNPTVLRNRSDMVALVSVLPYYLEGTERAYFRTRRLLEAAGAKQDMEGVKRKWLETCQRATPESRQKVLASPDLLVALESEGLRILNESRGAKQP